MENNLHIFGIGYGPNEKETQEIWYNIDVINQWDFTTKANIQEIEGKKGAVLKINSPMDQNKSWVSKQIVEFTPEIIYALKKKGYEPRF